MIRKVRSHPTQNESLLFELSSPGKKGYQLPPLDVPPVAAEAAPITRIHVSDRGRFGAARLDAHRAAGRHRRDRRPQPADERVGVRDVRAVGPAGQGGLGLGEALLEDGDDRVAFAGLAFRHHPPEPAPVVADGLVGGPGRPPAPDPPRQLTVTTLCTPDSATLVLTQ